MQQFDVSQPTRFRVVFNAPLQGKFIVLRKTPNGNVCNYYREFLTPKAEISFNLYQSGVYLFSDYLQVFNMGNVQTKSIVSPPADRQNRTPSLREFKREKNVPMGTPARVWRNEMLIQTNTTFERLPEQVQHAILLHEIGHFQHKTENGADMYAANELLSMGGNLSQLFYALELACADNEFNSERKQNLLKL